MSIKIHGKEYVLVDERVEEFHKLYPNGRIVSKLLKADGMFIVETKVMPDVEQPKRYFTGLAYEVVGSSQINNTSALENCETSATGRALAFLGFISDGIASAEEVSAAIVQQDKKIQSALKDLEAVSHKGSYTEWLSKNKSMLGELKIKNPIAYTTFMEDFKTLKSNLQTKGVI